jgi:hypothetical protein
MWFRSSPTLLEVIFAKNSDAAFFGSSSLPSWHLSTHKDGRSRTARATGRGASGRTAPRARQSGEERRNKGAHVSPQEGDGARLTRLRSLYGGGRVLCSSAIQRSASNGSAISMAMRAASVRFGNLAPVDFRCLTINYTESQATSPRAARCLVHPSFALEGGGVTAEGDRLAATHCVGCAKKAAAKVNKAKAKLQSTLIEPKPSVIGFRCYGLGFPKAESTCDGEMRNVCYTFYMPKTGKWGDDRLLCSWCLGEARLTDRPEDTKVMTPEAWGINFQRGGSVSGRLRLRRRGRLQRSLWLLSAPQRGGGGKAEFQYASMH